MLCRLPTSKFCAKVFADSYVATCISPNCIVAADYNVYYRAFAETDQLYQYFTSIFLDTHLSAFSYIVTCLHEML